MFTFTHTGGGAAEQQKPTKQEQQQNSSESCDSDPGSATHDSDSEDEGTEDYKKGQLCLWECFSDSETTHHANLHHGRIKYLCRLVIVCHNLHARFNHVTQPIRLFVKD